MGGPIGHDDFQYIKEVFNLTKKDWQIFKYMYSSSKWRIDVLTYCMRTRINHLLRYIEPKVTLQIVAELDQWFFSEACYIAGPDSDPGDKVKKHFMAI